MPAADPRGLFTERLSPHPELMLPEKAPKNYSKRQKPKMSGFPQKKRQKQSKTMIVSIIKNTALRA